MHKMKLPRMMLAAGASGSGKTTLTCGLLQALLRRKKKIASFKCGPDFIDPMFHRKVLGTTSGNLDLFFTSGEVVRNLLGTISEGCDLAVMEGVMGYYDGVGGTTLEASSYELACETDTPVLLIVNCRGMSTSLAAYLKGFLNYRENSRIRGVILNRMSPGFYAEMKEFLERETGIPVAGYVPDVKDCVIDSRHLGLVLPEEVPRFRQKLEKLADVLEETLDLDLILQIAEAAPPLSFSPEATGVQMADKPSLKIGVASDEAFCFIYPENLRFLEKLGAELLYFSPLRDHALPKGLEGLIFYGGYPELHARTLSENLSMRTAICEAVKEGLPVLAECGGFLYLQEELEDLQGDVYPMLGILQGRGTRTSRLSRFGYVQLSEQRAHPVFPASCRLKAHEFHYYDSTDCGSAFLAEKPSRNKSWRCIHDDGQIFAGFPHFYYYGNPQPAKLFLKRCQNYKNLIKECGKE